MTLTFDQYLGIAGLVVGIVGVALAVRLEQKSRTAQEAERRIERKFMHYMAAQEFEKLAMEAVGIMGKIRVRDWGLVPQLADKIGPALGQVRGARNRLLQPLERDRLDAAALNIQQFIDSLPLSGQEGSLTEPQIQTMVNQCRPLADVASEVAERLGVESIEQTEERK